MSDTTSRSAGNLPDWGDARNVLCVRLDSLGDVLMTTPAIRALKEAAPGRRVTLLTSPSGAAAARLAPEVDEVIVYEAPWMKHSSAADAGALREYAMAEQLRRRGFDAAVIFTVYTQNPLPAAFLCYLADIPLRLAHCRENPYQLLTDWVKDVEPEENLRHEVRRQLDLVATIGARPSHERLSVQVPPEAAEKLVNLLAAAGLDFGRPWFVLHPGATAASRRYPPELFAVVARRLIDEIGAQIVFTGSTDEIELIDQIRAQIKANGGSACLISVAGLLELSEMAALLHLTPLLVSNNTGPVHIAAGLGTATVVLYALTNPQHTPWMTPNKVLFHDVPCKFCYKSKCPLVHNNCLRLIPPERVFKAALGFLQTGSRAPAGATAADEDTERSADPMALTMSEWLPIERRMETYD